ncbi:hypothetical protein [Flexivirga sp. B27]
MTNQPTLQRRAPRAPDVDAPAHLARTVDVPPPRLAVVGLIAWIALCALVVGRHPMFSWHYFATAGQTLLTPDGLQVYGAHPELQFGPLTMGVCALLELVPAGHSAVVACVLMLGLGIGTAAGLADLNRSHHGVRVTRRAAMIYAALLAPLWLVLAVRYGHLDDALAIFLLTAAVAAGKRDRWLVAGLLLAAATGAKPWVLPMAVLLLAAPRPARFKSIAILIIGVAGPWIPFVLADSRTVQLGRFGITVADDSVLRQIGSLSFATPVWDRPAQFVLGALVAGWLVRRGRWMCVPFAVLSVRLLLDPQTYLYYAAGLAVAAAIADLTRRDRRPILTGLAVGWSAVALALVTSSQVVGAGTVRLVGLLAGLAVVIVDDGWAPVTHPASRRQVAHQHVTRRQVAHDPDPTPPMPQTTPVTPRVIDAEPELPDPPDEPITPDEPHPQLEPAEPIDARIDTDADSDIDDRMLVTHPAAPATSPASVSHPPRLGRLWSQTRKPVRPKTSSLFVHRSAIGERREASRTRI